ncbi:uncharacterized protein J4E87_003490 [Alternaria ethzedia]|uniref:uncharacterized protein n=1 Tax=Alternaria ethzedia TaxID=181014 RepID=UPI0020C50A78|nr:uncharacterized protein J4E87_003490 [Alternaria ethzedia]KAI4629228.1 hypothetical protein J4E87_003490 [Alternaria ethzedia]
MAIAKGLPNLKVQVYAKGIPLQEYVDDDDQASHGEVTKYVEASSGDNFEIRYCFTPGFSIRHSILLELEIDGEYADGGVYSPGCPVRWYQVYGFTGSREFDGGNHFLRKFRFSQLEINDGDPRTFEDTLEKKLCKVGVISVRFFWVTASVVSAPTTRLLKTETLSVVPEKALKGSALSHQAGYGPREADIAHKQCAATKLYQSPFAEFTFKYRSRDALKSLLIIPRTPSPVPLEERDVNSLTLEESRELIRIQRARGDATAVIKQEGIKRERSSTITGGGQDEDDVSFVSAKRRRLPVTLNENGVEIIDLT